MSNNWEVYTLREISRGKGQYGIAAPGIPYDPNLTRYLRITDITDDGFLIKDNKVSVNVNSEQYEKYILKKNDIVFARTGASAGRSYVYEEEAEPLIVAGFLIRYALNPEIVNPRFMRYYTISSNYKGWVAGVATGSTRPNINEKMLSSMEVKLPPLSEQNRIVQIFDSLEHKLKNNNNIIANLEEQAQAIFKSWFVDFEPFQDGEFVESELGDIPKGWSIESLGDIVNIYDSERKPLSQMVRQGMERNYPYYGANGVIDYVEDYLFDGKYLLLGEDGTVQTNEGYPILNYIEEKFWVSNHAHIMTGDKISTEFLYVSIKRRNIRDIITGAVQQKINQRNLKSIKLVIPESNILNNFQNIIEPIFEKILVLKKINKKLEETRDILLPKLMSGELRVEDTVEAE